MSRDYARLQKQDADDARWLAPMLSGPLHYTTKTNDCGNGSCAMCSNAARLAVQRYRPRIEARVIASIQYLYDVRCDLPHPGSDD